MRRVKRVAARAGALLLGASLVALSPATALPAAGQEQVHDRLYVAIQGEARVAVVNMTTLEEEARIDLTALGFSENASPHHVVVDPDGSHWYVSLIAENRVLRFDAQNRVVGEARMEAPGLMVRDATRDRVYVGRSMMAVNPPRSIAEIDIGSMAVELADVFFPRPHALAMAPGLDRIYAASLSQNQMGSVDPESFELELLNLEGPIHTLVQFAVSPDERTLVATAEMTGLLLVYDLADPVRPVLRRSIPVGRRPWHPVFEPGTNRVWFGTKGDGEVVGVDVATGEVIARISDPALLNPHGAAISADGRHLFISSNGPGGMPMMGDMDMAGDTGAHAHAGHTPPPPAHGGHAPGGAHPGEQGATGAAPTTGTLTVIDLATRTVVKVLEMGDNTTGIGTRQR
jgi:DNA-binding beta-propeller fold protein YncE